MKRGNDTNFQSGVMFPQDAVNSEVRAATLKRRVLVLGLQEPPKSFISDLLVIRAVLKTVSCRESSNT